MESVTKSVYFTERLHDTSQKLSVDVHVNGCLLTFRVDTGADVSLLDEESWNRIEQPELCEGREWLRNASGQLMTFKGVTRAQVCYCTTTIPMLAKEKVPIFWVWTG